MRARFKKIIVEFLAQIDHHKIDRDAIGVKAARALYRAMAIKDEYEVARLLTEAAFTAKLNSIGGDKSSIHYHLAPPILSWLKDSNGAPAKSALVLGLHRYCAYWQILLGFVKAGLIHLDSAAINEPNEHSVMRYQLDYRSWKHGIIWPTNNIEAVLDLMLDLRGYGHIKAENYAKFKPQITAKLTSYPNSHQHRANQKTQFAS